jgi:hypothetical protein
MNTIKRYFAGIGSRQTPEAILKVMVDIGKYLAAQGWVLRSGGAEGADKAFEYGCDMAQGEKEIYLPWKGYNGNPSQLYYKGKLISDDIKHQSFELAEKYHPAWGQCSYGAKCLLARDGLQILGIDLKTPVSMVIFWSPRIGKGGTSQALRIAEDNNIKIFNLGNTEHRLGLINIMGANGDFLEEPTFNLFQ